MAQVCGGTTFDFVARRKHDAALRVLSRASDLWAMHGRDALSVDGLCAVLLRVFLARWSQYGSLREEGRSLDAWLGLVGTAAQEAALFSTEYPGVVDALPLVLAELHFAAEQWLLGDPEQPSTAHALNAIEHILFAHRLSYRPPAPRLPTTLYQPSTNAPNA